MEGAVVIRMFPERIQMFITALQTKEHGPCTKLLRLKVLPDRQMHVKRTRIAVESLSHALTHTEWPHVNAHDRNTGTGKMSSLLLNQTRCELGLEGLCMVQIHFLCTPIKQNDEESVESCGNVNDQQEHISVWTRAWPQMAVSSIAAQQ